MASLDSLLSRSYAAETMTGRNVQDSIVALEIVPISAASTRSVTLTSNTNLVLINAGVTLTCTFGSNSGTLGALVDRINTSPHFQARIIDGLRSTVTTSSVLIPNSAITSSVVNGETVYKVLMDSSVNDTYFYRVAMDRGVFNNDKGIVKTTLPLGSHRVKLLGIKYRINLSGATINGVKIYEYDPVALTETLIYTVPSVDDTETTLDFTDFPLTAINGNELIVTVSDSAVTDTLTNFLEVNYVRE